MNEIAYNVESFNDELEIIVISDTHIGSAQFNETLLREVINYVLNTEGVYCILNGDILDNNLTSSIGDAYENAMTPSVALSYACLLFKPLADANKIICMTGGNHDYDRTKKIADISPSVSLAVHLGLEKRYSADSVLLYLNAKVQKTKHVTFTLFVNHGRNGGGGRTSGSKANALEAMSSVIPCCDVYIHSHSHYPITFKDEYYLPNKTTKHGHWYERLYVNTNAFLNYFNSYGEAKLYKPSSQSIPRIKLNVRRFIKGKIDRLIKSVSCEI